MRICTDFIVLLKGSERVNVIVTSGGTREKIDAVRTIANSSTGRLGCLIAQEFSNRLTTRDHTVYYLCGVGSVLPPADHSNIRIIPIEGTDQLRYEMNRLLTSQHIDAVIHAMAVSDYKVSNVTTPEQIAENLAEKFSGMNQVPPYEALRDIIMETLQKRPLNRDAKISSELEHPVMILEKTPKIIGMIKEDSPNTILVGFKLLSGVTEEKLIETAYHLLLKNKCDFVLANDTDSIHDGNHEGYLIDETANFVKFAGKEQIAKGIADSVMRKLSEDVE